MSTHHEELQEIENVKYFWRNGGKWIFAALLVAALGYLAYVVYQNHRQSQNEQAATLAAQIQSGKSSDVAALQQQYPDSMGAAQATLHTAAQAFAKGQYDEAVNGYRWVLEHQKAPLMQAAAAQNLANVYLQQKKYDEALQAAATPVEAAFQALMDETRGDIYAAQGKADEAKKAYQAALDKTEKDSPVREGLELKLAQL